MFNHILISIYTVEYIHNNEENNTMEQIGENQTMEEIRTVYKGYCTNTTWDGYKGHTHETFEEWLPSYLGQFNVTIIQ